ncbi:hypothetical protein [Actinophytocola glycyrrhizae]|uniref:WXG100 family type VII secretion target n=1 Tax=Actinophytocola glycyrrhizae TaxID=2044873 RepID=A0ABV9S799_9PSEU
MDPDWAGRMADLNENFQAILREHDEDGIGDSARLYHRIDRAFNLFSCGEGFAAEKMISSLGLAKGELAKEKEENFNGIHRDMEGWQGAAADQFLDWVNQLEGGVNVMTDRIDTLLMILQAHNTLVVNMRADVLDLVQKTLDGVAAAETDGWEVGMTVAGAVAGFAAGVAGSVGVLPAWAVLGTIAMNMAAGAPGVAVAVNEAADELGVMVRFVDSAEGMLDAIDIERLRIEKAFRELAASITSDQLVWVRPDRPDVITAPDFQPGAFGMEEDDQAGHPLPTDTSDLVPEPERKPDGQFDRTTGADGESHDRYVEQGPA